MIARLIILVIMLSCMQYKLFSQVEQTILPLKQMENMVNFKKELSVLNGIVKNPIVLHEAAVEYTMINNSASQRPSYYGDFILSSSWSVATVPFEFIFNNQTWSDIRNDNFSNPSIRFDREHYTEQLKKRLKDKFNPEAFASTLANPVEAIKANAEALLRKDLENISHDFGGGLKENIQQLGDLNKMFNKDIQSVRQQLLNNDYIKSIEDKERTFTELLNKKNAGQAVNKQQLDMLETEIKKMKGVNQLLAKIEEHKSRWQSSGLLNKMKQADLLNKAELEKIAKDPTAIGKMAKENFNLSGFQKLFLKINKLNLGQNTLSTGSLSLQHLMNKGINTEFLNNNNYLMLGVGKMKSLNSILDQPFVNGMSASDGIARMGQMGLGSTSSTHSHIALASYDQAVNEVDVLSPLNSFRNTLVATLSNQLSIGTKGVLTTELSRSATQYKQTAVSDSSLANKPATQRIASPENFMKNMAFALKYEDELEYLGLSYGLHVNKTANGYINPGNSFLNSGSKELGIKLRKSFWKSKLQASIRSDVREFNYGSDNSKRWRNFSNIADVRLRLRKGQSIGIRYMPNKMLRIENGEKYTMTFMERLSVEGNVSQKIAGTFYRNNFTLSRQKNNYDAVTNTSFTISSFQNIVVKDKLLYVNLNYDYAHNRSQLVYFNSSLLTEAGCTYLLFKKLSMSSSLSYNSVQQWYQQVGFKQTISNQLSDRFNLNVYIDARKNIKLQQPLLYGLFRADISIHYLIKR